MNCQWKDFLAVVPIRMRTETDRLGRDVLTELRLRRDRPPELRLQDRYLTLEDTVTQDDLSFVINTATRYSPWTGTSTASGYLTAPGGHRIGMCGEAVINGSTVTGIRNVSSVCIRVARDYPGIGRKWGLQEGNLLIIGPPGSGKTTLLRDIARLRADRKCVAVVDERGELFPEGLARGKHMDVLTGAGKAAGIDMLLRTMGPETIAVDEITAEADCKALQHAFGCGVQLLATAHADSVNDLKHRAVYSELLRTGIFRKVIVLHPRFLHTEEAVA